MPVWEAPRFLDLPERHAKPRDRGLTHVLDKGLPLTQAEGMLESAGAYMDVVKLGWGIAYLDAALKDRVALYQSAGVTVCVGGTLFEVAAYQNRLNELRRWVTEVGIDAIEVSNGLCALSRERKREIVGELSRDHLVLAEAGVKDAAQPVSAEAWVAEMRDDLAAGARWVVAEGRESGTVGLYETDGLVRELLVETLAASLPVDKLMFEAPRRAQQAWFVRRFGPNVNLGNIAPDEVLSVETIRVGLRADTAKLARRPELR